MKTTTTTDETKWTRMGGVQWADVGSVRVIWNLGTNRATFTNLGQQGAPHGPVEFTRVLDVPFPENVPDAEVEEAARAWAERIARAMLIYPAAPDLLMACIWAREFIATVASDDIAAHLDAAIAKAGGVPAMHAEQEVTPA